jgi:hypothetical protein
MFLNMLLTGRRDDTSLDLAERRRAARWLCWPFTASFVAWIAFRVYVLSNGEHVDLEKWVVSINIGQVANPVAVDVLDLADSSPAGMVSGS